MRSTTLVCALSLFGTSVLGANAVTAGLNDKVRATTASGSI